MKITYPIIDAKRLFIDLYIKEFRNGKYYFEKSGKTYLGRGFFGKKAYDYSSEIIEIKDIESYLIKNPHTTFSEIYTGDWKPSFEPHCGKFNISYYDKCMDYFEEIILNKFIEINKQFEIDIDALIDIYMDSEFYLDYILDVGNTMSEIEILELIKINTL